ncbi:hypothetical protein ACVJMZ_005757 [Sinorhizobium medicae]
MAFDTSGFLLRYPAPSAARNLSLPRGSKEGFHGIACPQAAFLAFQGTGKVLAGAINVQAFSFLTV